MILLAVLFVAGCFGAGLLLALLILLACVPRSPPPGGVRMRQGGYYRKGRWVRSHTKRLH